jgi:hypothetical protein
MAKQNRAAQGTASSSPAVTANADLTVLVAKGVDAGAAAINAVTKAAWEAGERGEIEIVACTKYRAVFTGPLVGIKKVDIE